MTTVAVARKKVGIMARVLNSLSHVDTSHGAANRLSPVAVVIIALMFIFPFFVRFLPVGVRQYLDLLYR